MSVLACFMWTYVAFLFRHHGDKCNVILMGIKTLLLFFLRAKAAMLLARLSHRNSVRPSVCPSVCHTGGSGKNGPS